MPVSILLPYNQLTVLVTNNNQIPIDHVGMGEMRLEKSIDILKRVQCKLQRI